MFKRPVDQDVFNVKKMKEYNENDKNKPTFSDLPPEILLKIFEQQDLKSRNKLARTDKKAYYNYNQYFSEQDKFTRHNDYLHFFNIPSNPQTYFGMMDYIFYKFLSRKPNQRGETWHVSNQYELYLDKTKPEVMIDPPKYVSWFFDDIIETYSHRSMLNKNYIQLCNQVSVNSNYLHLDLIDRLDVDEMNSIIRSFLVNFNMNVSILKEDKDEQLFYFFENSKFSNLFDKKMIRSNMSYIPLIRTFEETVHLKKL